MGKELVHVWRYFSRSEIHFNELAHLEVLMMQVKFKDSKNIFRDVIT